MAYVARSALDAVESCLLAESCKSFCNAVTYGLTLNKSVDVVTMWTEIVFGVAVCSEVAVYYDSLLQVGSIFR